MEKMDKFTHPIELSDEQLDLVAAGCGCDNDGSLVNVENNTVQANVAGIIVGNQTNFA